jgi:hypothetical protein
VRGIAQWRSQSAASQRRVDGGTHLGVGEKNSEKERKPRLIDYFYNPRRERELRGGPPESASNTSVEPDW